MGKRYVSKRLKNRDLRLENYKNAKSIDNNVQTSIEHVSTTIEKKLRLSRAQLLTKSTATTQTTIEDEDESVSYDIPYTNVNIIVSINMILDLVNKFRCPSCGRVGKMSEKVTQRRGLLYHITFSCKCSYETHFKNSTELVHSSTLRMDELNMMACVAANVVGMKRTGMTTVLGMLNILSPVQTKSWKKYQKIYSDALDVVKDKSLRRAAREARKQSSESADQQAITNIKVSVDGTWLTRRGHSSLHGIATVCSTSDPPKVLDFECLSRHCTTCSGLLGIREHNPEMYEQLLEEHIQSGCEANHKGSSGGMEAAGIVKVFRRSESKYLLRYTTYIGDGDANNERALRDAQPYEDIVIKRLQCINHFSKRMRTALETLKKKHKGDKLEDDKPIGGRSGRLTDDKIHQLTVYYGSAIRSHVNDLESMKAACWATFHHYNSTRENPNHDYCDPTKCHIYRYKSFDTSKHTMAPAVMKAIRPVYEKMCSDDTLSKVVDGGTTNPNESYHSCIWSLCPKTQFHSAKYVQDAASLAALIYNDGYQLSIMELLEKCGIKSKTPACVSMTKLLDNQRIKENKVKNKSTKQKVRQQRILTEQSLNKKEKYNYARGGFD
ncbi:unnamed protein product [Adineta steineri]|uniref:Mutator-like transposase domain-containing protein n=1 Tax=Adineta steineri TaxID=433720 RepID=A0A815WIC7_9BILA|nr:unnamed protein product [Adineta steineri]CAF1657986.1 unnamed protein product [Adineta steineri]